MRAATDQVAMIPFLESAMRAHVEHLAGGVREVDAQTHACRQILPGDVWTTGYTPAFVLGIWAGNADNAPLTPEADGLTVTAPLWTEFLEKAHALRPQAPTSFPASLIERYRRP